MPAKQNTSKRKLVGAAAGDEEAEENGHGASKINGKTGPATAKAKKKKKAKGMLSFNEADGEE